MCTIWWCCGLYPSKSLRTASVIFIADTVCDSGAWILFPIYMIYVFGGEILDGLEAASFAPAANGESKKEL